jgi:tRNA nucleotidyltransferase (CCA-adding enzyme)
MFEIRRKYPTAKWLLEDWLMACSLGKKVHQSVNEGFEIIECAGICRLKDSEFRVF